MAKNPFEVFGLTPQKAGELSERELFAVVKALYRALQKTVHPDLARPAVRRRGADRAVELNLAFEALNLEKDPASFRRHRKNFVARRPALVHQKNLALRRELEDEVGREDGLASAYLARLAYGRPWRAAAEGVPAGAVPFPLANARLGLLDVAINQNIKMCAWGVGSNYKEMRFDGEGRLSLKPVGRGRFSRVKYIHLLGAVMAAEIDLLPLLNRPAGKFFKAPALNASIGADGPALTVVNSLTTANFKRHVLPLLQPWVAERSYIFSLSRPEFEAAGDITLEGLVVKIERTANG